MVRRVIHAVALALVMLLSLATPALAGGWAVVTLDTLPSEVRVGQMLHLGFMVRQHGRTPIDEDPFNGGPLKPYLTATNAKGEVIRVEARKEGPLGHFVVDVTFSSAGVWDWEITPPPFEGTHLEPLNVLAAAPTAVEQPATMVLAPGGSDALRWGALALLLVAVALALIARRDSLGRLLGLRLR